MTNPVKVEITGDATSLLGALNQGTAGLKSFAKDIDGVGASFGNLLKGIQAPFIALAGLAGGVAFLKNTVAETVEWTVQAQKLARTLGVSTEAASAFGVAIKNVHGEADTFLGIAAKMTRTLNTNEGAFNNLGVATRDSDGHLRNSQEVLLDTFEALRKMQGGTDANVASTQIFGRNFLEVQKYVKLTRDSLKEAREEAERLNLIVGADSVAAVNRYRKASEDLALTEKGLKISIGQELIPVMTALNEDLSENGPAAVSALGGAFTGLYQIIFALREQLEKLITYIIQFSSQWVASVKAAWGTATSLMRHDWDGAKAAFKGYEDERTRLAKVGADDRAEIESRYAEKTMKLMGLGPKAKAPSDPTGGNHADTKDHKEKQNAYLEERNKLRAEGIALQAKETLAQKESAAFEAAQLALDEQMARYKKEEAAGTLTASQAEKLRAEAAQKYADKLISIQENMDRERLKIDTETLAKISVFENEGIEKQIAAKKKEFAEINRARHAAGLEGIADSVLQEQIAILKSKEMLKNPDTSKWSVMDGMLAGLDDFLKQSKNKYEQYKAIVTGVLSGVQSSFATAFKGILSGQMNFSSALKSLWSGISNAIVDSLAKVAAQYVTTAIAQEVFSQATTTASATQTAASTQQAAAEIWTAYGDIPYVGTELALAEIAIMMASVASSAVPITAHALGGLIDRPTLALMGEIPGSREIVAPESTFKDWANNLTANILHSERQIQGYQAQGGRYAQAASQGGAPDHLHVHLEGAVIAGESVESGRIIGNMVKKHLDAYSRRRG
jgi:hypothetical protein